MTDNSEQGMGGVDAAWETFEERLAERIRELDESECVLMEALDVDEDAEGAVPYVQFMAWDTDGERLVRCEAVSNHFLRVSMQLDDVQSELLQRIGFAPPTYGPEEQPDSGSSNHFADLDRDAESIDAASIAVRALREVYGVEHPAFLVADEDLVPAAPQGYTPAVMTPVDTDVITVRNATELKQALELALTPHFGHAPIYDEDGDIQVDTEHGCFYIRINPDVAVIDLFARVASDVTDRRRGLHEVNVLTQEQPFVQFALRGTNIMAHLRVDCDPFVPGLVVDHVGHMAQGYDHAVEALGQRLADLGSTADQERREARRAAFRVVKELVAAEISERWDHQVTPEVVASACGDDEQLVVDLIQHTQRLLTTCRRKLHEQPHRRSLMREEARLRRQRRLLREALLLLVTTQADLAPLDITDMEARRAG